MRLMWPLFLPIQMNECQKRKSATEINFRPASFSLLCFLLSMAPKTKPLERQNSSPRPMPSAPLSSSLPTCSSSCSKLITLSDWWLIKSETDVDGKRLGVGGYHHSCEENNTMHIFTSAPVVKTLDPYTVETADGFTLRLQGAINRSRMLQNGFPPEVSQCFFIGFPYNWEYYAKKDLGSLIPSSAIFPASSVISNEQTFPLPVAFEFPLVNLFNDCASNPESSVDDLLLKCLTSSPVNAESHDRLYMSDDSVQSETMSASEKGNDDVERCTKHECHESQNGVSCENLINSPLNVNCVNQNESRQMLRNEYLPNEESEINNEKEDNSAGKDPEHITRKTSSAVEASSESPQACTQRKTDTESNPSSGVTPVHNRVGCEHLPSSSSNVMCDNQNESWEMLPVESLSEGAEINNEKLNFEKIMDSVNYTDDFSNALLPEDSKSLHSRQKDYSAKKDPKFITRKISSTLEASFGTPQACAQRNTNTESYSSSVDKFCSSLSSPFASSLLKEMLRRKKRGSELNLQSHSKRVRVNLPNDDSDVLGPTFNENTDILPLSGKERTENDTEISCVDADAASVRKHNSDCYMLRSRDTEMEINRPNCDKKSNSRVQSRNISEEMKSPLTGGKMGKQKATLSTSPELLNPKRSRSGRLLLPPINRWQREIVYDMDGSVTNIADVDKLTSVTGDKSKRSRRRK